MAYKLPYLLWIRNLYFERFKGSFKEYKACKDDEMAPYRSEIQAYESIPPTIWWWRHDTHSYFYLSWRSHNRKYVSICFHNISENFWVLLICLLIILLCAVTPNLIDRIISKDSVPEQDMAEMVGLCYAYKMKRFGKEIFDCVLCRKVVSILHFAGQKHIDQYIVSIFMNFKFGYVLE